MGKRNREKRAAKKRVRQGKGPTEARHEHFPFEPEDVWALPPLSPELVADTLAHAAYAHATGDSSVATEFASGRFGAAPRVVAIGAGIALGKALEQLWEKGWLPIDLWEVVRRFPSESGAELLVDGIAADSAKYASATVHERWAAQVHGLGADVWWDRDRPHLLQWAERAGTDLEQALLRLIWLIATLLPLPKLPHILPRPGAATAQAGGRTSGVDQKVLSRVRGLLAKAESTQFPEEAEALSAKAQELMNRYAFERALLDADTHRKQAAGSVRLWLDAPYLDAKSHLITAIAEANRCRSVLYNKLGFAALVGEETDLELAELLATSLLVQATRAMVTEGSHTTRTGTSRTRSFRQSFLIAYAVRIGERLGEAGARAHDPVEDARLLPVLADRSRVVEETFQKMFRDTVERKASVTNGAGWHAGRAAADHADLKLERDTLGA